MCSKKRATSKKKVDDISNGRNRIMDAMHIITLLENSPGKAGLKNQHGLSLLIETSGKRILFDAGPSDAMSENAKALGVHLSDIDAAILSHGHYDHSGGLGLFFQENSKAPLYVRDSAEKEYYATIADRMEYIGVDKALFQKYADRIIRLGSGSEIMPGVHIILSIPERWPRPIGNCLLYSKENGTYVPDRFGHELVCVIEEADGIVIFSGCGHSGILNMVQAVRDQFPKQRIKAVVGGFHLMLHGFPKDDMARNMEFAAEIADRLAQIGCEKIISGHCTGEEATKVLRERLGDRHLDLSTGMEFDL